jgi:hypothetical protein
VPSEEPLRRDHEWRSLSPLIDLSSDCEMVSPPRPDQAENIAPLRAPSSGQAPTIKPPAAPSKPAPSSRPALASRSGNIALQSRSSVAQEARTGLTSARQEVSAAETPQMQDPHFVLGISKRAGEAEYVYLSFPSKTPQKYLT